MQEHKLFMWSYGIFASILLLMIGLFCPIDNIFEYYLQFIVIIAFIVLLYIVKHNNYNDFTYFGKKGIAIVVLLYLLSFLSRYLFLKGIDPHIEQVSDFGMMMQRIIDADFSGSYYSNFPHKILYPLLLHAIGVNTQSGAFFVQSLILSFIPVFLYLLGTSIDGISVGIVAAVIYIITPSQIAYSAIITEEHAAALLSLIFIYIVVCCWKKCDNILDSVLLGFLSGVILAILHFLKDWGAIAIVAYVIVMSIVILSAIFKQCSVKNLAVITIFVLVCFLIRGLVYKTILTNVEKITNQEISAYTTTELAYRSFSPLSDGGYDEERTRQYYAILGNYDGDRQKADQEALSILIQEIYENIELMPGFLLKKGRNAYNTTCELFWWLKQGLQEGGYKKAISSLLLFRIEEVVYLSVILFSSLGICIGNKARNDYKSFKLRNWTILFLVVFMIGTISVSLIIEDQSRYKYSVYWLWVYMAARGADMFGYAISNKIKYKK